MLRQIRCLVFDLDYLVFDCAALKERTLRQSLLSFSDQIPQDMKLPDAADIEAGFRELGSHWVRALEIGLDEQQLKELERTYRIQETPLIASGIGGFFHGVRDLIACCVREGLSTVLGAESSRDHLMSVFDRHDMERLFEIAVCSEEYGMGGTDEMLAEIMRHAEVNPSETLILGTRPHYFEAGHNLDIRGIGCGWGLSQSESFAGADYQSLSIEHLIPMIRQADASAASYFE